MPRGQGVYSIDEWSRAVIICHKFYATLFFLVLAVP